ncbi:MAG: hypothetical protein S4CHLAM20_08430 [Chlamydiia bacterium]|nr:hypothetical protein [Chlamydiia bacterium]
MLKGVREKNPLIQVYFPPLIDKIYKLLTCRENHRFLSNLKSYITKHKITDCSISEGSFAQLLKAEAIPDIRDSERVNVTKFKYRILQLIKSTSLYLNRKPDSSDKATLENRVKLYFKASIFEAEHYKNQIPKIYHSLVMKQQKLCEFTAGIKALKKIELESLQAVEDFFSQPCFQPTTPQPSSYATLSVKRAASTTTNPLQVPENNQLSTSSSSTMTSSTSVASSSSFPSETITLLFKQFYEIKRKMAEQKGNLMNYIRSKTTQVVPMFPLTGVAPFLKYFPEIYQKDKELNTRSINNQFSSLGNLIRSKKTPTHKTIQYIKSFFLLRRYEWDKHLFPIIKSIRAEKESTSITRYKDMLKQLKASGEALIQALKGEHDNNPS